MSANHQCFAIVLAAGRASRFGSSKLLQEIGNTSIVARSVQLASAVCGHKVLLVLGHDRDRIRAAAATAANAATAHIINEQFASGLSSSIVSGVEALEHCADAVLILLADQVAIPKQHLQDMLDVFDGHTAVATEFADSVGPPAIFPKRHFAALKSLRGDRGARQLLQDGTLPVVTVRCEHAAIDIDTPDDLERMI